MLPKCCIVAVSRKADKVIKQRKVTTLAGSAVNIAYVMAVSRCGLMRHFSSNKVLEAAEIECQACWLAVPLQQTALRMLGPTNSRRRAGQAGQLSYANESIKGTADCIVPSVVSSCCHWHFAVPFPQVSQLSYH